MLAAVIAWATVAMAPALWAAEPAAAAQADEPAVVRGRVLLPDGKPAAGAELYWLHFNVPEPKTPDDVSFAKRGISDADGRFQLVFEEGDAPLATMRPLLAYKRGYGVEWIAVGPGAAPPETTLKLCDDHPVRGRVLDTEGRAVVGANVVATQISAASEGNLDEYLIAWKKRPQQARRTLDHQFLFLHAVGPALAAVTDEHGRFELLGVGAERVALVHISAPGIVKAEFNVVNREQFDPAPFNQAAANQFPGARMPGRPSELSGPVIEHVAEAELVVRGTVFTGPDRKPVSGANVSSFGNGTYNIAATRTDEAGRFELRGLRRREVPNLQVRVPPGDKFLFRVVELEVPLGQTVINVDVEVKEGVFVEGRVFDKTTGRGVRSGVQFTPLPGNPYAEQRRPTVMLARNQTDDEGRFRLLVMPGPAVLMAQVRSDRPAALGGPQLGGNKPIPYRQASFSEEDSKRVTVTVDDENRYFASAYRGSQPLMTENAVKVIDVAPGSGPMVCDLPLDPGKTAMIAIEDEQGRPVSDAIVSGIADTWPIAFRFAEPSCTIYGLGADRPRQVCILQPDRHLAASFLLTGDEPGAVTVRLSAAASIAGRALDSDGEPLADAVLQIYYPRRSAQELITLLNRDKPPLKTDADGRFLVDNVPPGERFSLGFKLGDAFFGGPRITDEKRQLKPGEQIELGEFKAKQL